MLKPEAQREENKSVVSYSYERIQNSIISWLASQLPNG